MEKYQLKIKALLIEYGLSMPKMDIGEALSELNDFDKAAAYLKNETAKTYYVQQAVNFIGRRENKIHIENFQQFSCKMEMEEQEKIPPKWFGEKLFLKFSFLNQNCYVKTNHERFRMSKENAIYYWEDEESASYIEKLSENLSTEQKLQWIFNVEEKNKGIRRLILGQYEKIENDVNGKPFLKIFLNQLVEIIEECYDEIQQTKSALVSKK